jgi:uncharacterized protein involved in exopolysaccharide biosynthesis
VNEVRAWTVALDAVEDSDEFPRDRRRKNRVRRNLSGIAVELTDGHERVEVARVAFVRRNSRNPEADFGEQLAAEIDKAEQAAEALNEWLDERERMIEEQYMEIQDRVREIVGEPAELPA